MINDRVVQICEILGRASEGATEPVRCRGDDGVVYYVKGRNAGRRSQICEWVCSNLGLAFGLPIPEPRIVDVPPELVEFGPDWQRGLGGGLAFGSRACSNMLTLPYSAIAAVDPQVQCDLLVFDWWVKNQDRTLTEKGGNPNLLWSVQDRSVTVIDFNLAFDTEFNVAAFAFGHAFCDQFNRAFGDWVARQEYHRRLDEAAMILDQIFDSMPDDWLWLGPDVPTTFGRNDVEVTLGQLTDPDFWAILK